MRSSEHKIVNTDFFLKKKVLITISCRNLKKTNASSNIFQPPTCSQPWKRFHWDPCSANHEGHHTRKNDRMVNIWMTKKGREMLTTGELSSRSNVIVFRITISIFLRSKTYRNITQKQHLWNIGSYTKLCMTSSTFHEFRSAYAQYRGFNTHWVFQLFR